MCQLKHTLDTQNEISSEKYIHFLIHLGFSCLASQAKVLMQDVWVSGIDWYEELNKECKDARVKWFQELHELPLTKVPTCLISSGKRDPLKSKSISRSEFCSAVQFSKINCKCLNINYKWTDNMNVFYRIHNEGGLLEYFVLNQAGEIQTYTEPSRWRYVSTK